MMIVVVNLANGYLNRATDRNPNLCTTNAANMIANQCI